MKCQHCQSTCTKAGLDRNNEQRYYCKRCRKYQKETYRYHACQQGINHNIAVLVKESCGIRSIGRILNISCTTVISRIKAIATNIKRKSYILKYRTYELDEIRTYIKSKKNLYWIVYAIDRLNREVIAFKIGKRSKKTLKIITDTLLLSGARKIFTDGYKTYRYLIPALIHNSKRYQTNHIERMNLNIRTHIKRLARRTICFSKSVFMLEACLRIYFWY